MNEHYFFDVDEFEDIIEYYFFKEDDKIAEQCISDALDQHPGDLRLLLKKAQQLANSGNSEKALTLLSEIPEDHISDPEVHVSLGNLYSQLERPEIAIKEYLAGISDSEENDDIYASIGFEYENMSRYDKAIEYLRLSLEQNPENEPVLYEISFCFEITQQSEKAIKFLSDFLDKNPFSAAAWFNQGIAYSNCELYEKAIDAYDFALAIDEFFGSAAFNKANCLANLGKYEEAIKVYLESGEYEEDPGSLSYYYIAECYEKLENFPRAIEYYKKCIEQDPDFADAWVGAGLAYDSLNKPQTAIAYIQKAIQVAPTVWEYWFIQGDLHIKLGQIEEGIASYRKVIELEPNDSEVWLELSYVYYQQGDLAKALDVLKEGMKWHEENPDFLYGMACYLLRSGRQKQAYMMLDKALHLDYDGYRRMFKQFPELAENNEINHIIETFKNNPD
ncbi:MAG: tetratricopeptide repeat protein [Bacteroidota bacterium]|nr:tetratricopeptide repeat protein [Bacteroidota bacterium]